MAEGYEGLKGVRYCNDLGGCYCIEDFVEIVVEVVAKKVTESVQWTHLQLLPQSVF